MKILITGYNGFIGSHLVKELSNTAHELILADLSNGIDICQWDQMKDISNLDAVIHLANLSFVPASYQEPKRFYETNYLSTLNMLELCRLNKAKLIYFSSYMYGHPQYQPIDENHPMQAYNPYSQTKLICEKLCEGYNRDFGVEITIFRPFNIYGNGQHPDFLIPSIIKQAKEGSITIKDDRPKRDYIHVEDVVRAVLAAIKNWNKSASIDVFNIGSGVSHSVNEIVKMVQEIAENPIDYHCTHETRPNEVMDTIADISKIQQTLDWAPEISLRRGLEKLMKE